MKIVFFDGYCRFCNRLIDWLIQIDKTGEIKFASLQGETAQRLLGNYIAKFDVNTVIYLRCEKKYEQSTAILQVLLDIGGFWNLVRVFFLVPKFMREGIYRLIANNRYRIYGKRSTCRMPSPDEIDRLLP